MRNRLFTMLILSVSICWADTNQIRQLFQAILSSSSDSALPIREQINSQLDVIDALPAREVEAILPLAKQCLQSSNLEVRQAGLMLFSAVSSRLDSPKLIDPFARDLGVIIGDLASPFRQFALAILAVTVSRPGTSANAVGTLAAHLEDKINSPQETSSIGAALLGASPSDAAMVHKILAVAEKRSEFHITVGVLAQLGLTKTHNPEALSFIGKNLDSSDPQIRETAVEAASRLARDNRTGFAARLGRIAADHTEPQHVRTQAAEALR